MHWPKGTIAPGSTVQQIRTAGLEARAAEIHDWLPSAIASFWLGRGRDRGARAAL